jgi:peptidoglycan/LPS O-acetylase OafA/YrhL
MVAVLTVFANHLWGWPQGGFIGVDVFFVISGFLITGNLLRDAEARGTVSFRTFYWNRIRRIVPAATVVLILTYVVSVLVFLPFRTHQIGIDALSAFVFLSNWRFAIEGTDYFAAAAQTVSPLQHYWSLSIEEQFYFVWPALIFVISLIILRKGWTHAHRMQVAGGVMGVIVASSLAWALYETAESPTWAYFNTFARVWELGVGALLATSIGLLARIPSPVKPLLSWAGLALIAASLILIADGSSGFPAPWALMPVAGAAMVIAAGVGAEPKFQAFLRNPVSGYIGDISYSLYLVHWPVIIILGALLDTSIYFYVAVLALSFGLAVASYHLIENPLRHADRAKLRGLKRQIRNGRYWPEKSSQYAAVGATALVLVALCAYVQRPVASDEVLPSSLVGAGPNDAKSSAPELNLGPAASALQDEIHGALKATEWPELDPSMESVIGGLIVPSEIGACSGPDGRDPDSCVWGSNSAETRVVVVGDSIAMAYLEPLRQIVLNSRGKVQVRAEAMFGCEFTDDLLYIDDDEAMAKCPDKKQQAIDVINATKPDVVIISNAYLDKKIAGSDRVMTPDQWSESIRRIVDKIRDSTKKIVFLAAPPADVNIQECYGKSSSRPPKCVSSVTPTWRSRKLVEQDLAKSIGGTWIDSRPWFCFQDRCPSFVGLTPTKWDYSHMSTAYGLKIAPVVGESLQKAGVF